MSIPIESFPWGLTPTMQLPVQFEIAGSLQGSGVSNPTQLLYTAGAGTSLMVTSFQLSYASSGVAGASEAMEAQIQYGPVVSGGLGSSRIASITAGVGDKSVNAALTFAPPWFIVAGQLIWLYISGTPTTTDGIYAVLRGYTSGT